MLSRTININIIFWYTWKWRVYQNIKVDRKIIFYIYPKTKSTLLKREYTRKKRLRLITIYVLSNCKIKVRKLNNDNSFCHYLNCIYRSAVWFLHIELKYLWYKKINARTKWNIYFSAISSFSYIIQLNNFNEMSYFNLI